MKFIDSNQVSERLGIAKRTLSRMMQDGRFPTTHGKGRLMRWLDEEVDAYMIFYSKKSKPIPKLSKERLVEIEQCARRAAKN